MKLNKGIMLDIGCGANKNEGWTGLDIRPLPGVDIVWDINKHPWPIDEATVLTALASHLVEHIPPVAIGPEGTWFPFIEFMNEVWRILVPGGQLAIVVPYATSPGFSQDPTHINQCNEHTWFYFDPDPGRGRVSLWSIYKPLPWKIEKLYWDPAFNMEVLLRKRDD